MKTGILLVAAITTLVAVIVVGSGPVASAATGPRLEVSVIHATRTDGGVSVDPELRSLPQLTRDQPFVRYNVYRLLDRKQFVLETGKAIVYPLANGRTLHIVFEGVGDDGGEKRYQLQAQIGEPGKKAYLRSLEVTASENQAFFVGGQTYQGGTLFLELVVRP